MKRSLLGILAIAIVAGFSAFTGKRTHKTFSVQTYYWRGVFQKADGTVTGQPDERENSVTAAMLANVNNWSLTSNGGTQGSGDYLAAIIFDEEFDADNNADGQLTLQQAVNAVAAYFIANDHQLPPDKGIITESTSGCIITIKRRG